jgi:hypothetical protein
MTLRQALDRTLLLMRDEIIDSAGDKTLLAALTRQRKRCCRTSSCRRITTCAPATSSRDGSIARSPRLPSAVLPTFRICR